MKTVVVTGANSFTGKYVSSLLEERGYKVVKLVRNKNTDDQVECDLSDKSALKELFSECKPDFIIHLAALTFVAHEEPKDFYDVNIFTTLNILEVCEELKLDISKIVLSSSANIYGNPSVKRVSEEINPAPVNHYSMSKYAMECMSKLWFDRLPILITRPFNYTGPGQTKKFLVPKIVDHFKSNQKKIELGNTDVYRDFSDVRDICNYYIDLMESDVHSDFVNLCSGAVYSLSYIIEEMEKIAGYKIKVDVNPAFVRSNEIKELGGDNSKLINIIGDRETTPLSKTLLDMYNEDTN